MSELSDGMRPLSGITLVSAVRPPLRFRKYVLSSQAVRPVAMKLSMIVEITSLTPRVTFKMPAIAAHAAATSTAIRTMYSTWRTAGRSALAPK